MVVMVLHTMHLERRLHMGSTMLNAYYYYHNYHSSET